MFSLLADNRGGQCVLHLRLHPLLLSEDPPGHAGPSHQKHHREHDREQHVGLDFGQAHDQRTHRLFLHRVPLQRLVHLRVHNAFRRVPEQVRLYQVLSEHYRLRGHAIFLHRSHIGQIRQTFRERGHSRIFQYN